MGNWEWVNILSSPFPVSHSAPSGGMQRSLNSYGKYLTFLKQFPRKRLNFIAKLEETMNGMIPSLRLTLRLTNG
jgi:hypothetical protein